MRETIGIRTLNNSIDLNNLYLTEGSVSYAVDGNTLNNYPTIDRGILTVNKANNNIPGYNVKQNHAPQKSNPNKQTQSKPNVNGFNNNKIRNFFSKYCG